MSDYYPYPKRDPIKNYFPLPNEIFMLGLTPGELAVYSYLMRCEDRKTHQCHPSYRTIGRAVHLSQNTVAKHVNGLREKLLIVTENTEIVTRRGEKRNGTLLYTIRPVEKALRHFYEQQMHQLETVKDQETIRKKLAELDAIVHERIPRALAQKMAATNAEIIGLDAIKLIESGLGAICDATVAVTAPEEVRVKRIMARDSITEEYARSRIAAQKDADYFRAQCDYEFVNDLPTAEKAEHAAEVYINTIINNLKEETER